jgi:hypothetical protein
MIPAAVRLIAGLLFVSQAVAVPVKLEMQLDDYPEHTSWEIRGPFPKPTLVDGVTYNYYQEPNSDIEEFLELDEGVYWLMLNDFTDDGIQDGHFRLIAGLASGPVILVEGTGDFGSGKIIEFEIPVDHPVVIQTPRNGAHISGSRSVV